MLLAGAMLLGLPLSSAQAGVDQDQMITRAFATVQRVQVDRTFNRVLRDELRHARGVLIIPSFYKAGLLLGGQGGSGVLLAHDPITGVWSYPIFQALIGGQTGLRARFEGTAMLVIIRSVKGMNAVLRDDFRFGSKSGLTLLSLGSSLDASPLAIQRADVIAYALGGAGAYGGIPLKGATLYPKDSWTSAYYGRPVEPKTVLFGKGVFNHQADALRHALAE